ncbi:hypothetical protein OC25_04250 [Pedobacter kyungheensis]|uniref:Uncharacterized protein n=1 Tax=Pedobacter kyungheensis TaxID=1069985 RepID=A0A0C1G6M6_9SPHI|nr:baseplate J/gp47 family protein [Pedobacter kyungheensis]KIA95774.1 hypothetical protein OC25_04250 [Pedobacter kyungheensis]
MSSNCNKNNAPRNGTNRLNRLPKALDASFVAIDERDKNSLCQFCDKLAAYINYYYYDGLEKKSNWQSVFDINSIKEDGTSEPHLALFDAFLELYAIAQKDLNEFTGKHLDYFFETVLGFEKKAAQPDKVYLIIELAKHITQYILNDKTEFKAGKNSKKQEQFYQLLSDFSFSHAQVASIHSILVDQTEKTKIYASPIANSGDGKGAEITNQDGSWDIFGNTSRDLANIGFAISSPLFRMSEGLRNITLQIVYNVNMGAIPLTPSNFKVSISAEKAWLNLGVTSVGFTNNQLKIVIDADASQPKFVDYNQKIHLNDFRTSLPVLRVEIVSAPNLYSLLNGAAVNQININTAVTGVKNLSVQNNLGKLDPAKPMEIFGATPTVGSNFYIGSKEIFQQKLASLKLNFEFLGLPATNFADYYKYYADGTNAYVNNTDFKIKLSYLSQRSWIDTEESITIPITETINGVSTPGFMYILGNGYLFGDDDTVAPASGFSSSFGIPSSIKANYNLDFNETYNLDAADGYVKLQLISGKFGQTDFPIAFSRAVINKRTDNANLPNAPYLPVITNLTIDYTCSETIALGVGATQSAYHNRIHQFYNLAPFGQAEVHPYTHGTVYLLPQQDNEGELYIGLTNAVVPQNLSLLFKVSEGSANPDFDKAVIKWAYLQHNRWVEFEKINILREQTNGLLTTGIVTLNIPKTVNTDNTLLANGLLWIRAAVTTNAAALCDIISITAQAAEAQFAVYDDVVPENIAIGAGVISKLKSADNAVKKVTQPYSSFDGKAIESANDYHLRVSEILRHKRRAITLWDYEHLILAQFPEVYTTKCINHTFYNGNVSSYNALSPGEVTIIAVPDIAISNAPNPLQPKVAKNTLGQIKTYLSKNNSAFAKLNVQNPIFEEIKLHFHVKLREGYEENIYLPQLKTQLKALLAPWTSNAATQMEFGGKIEKSTIIYQLEKLAYVDYITCVKMYLFRPAGLEDISAKDLETAETATAASILTAYPDHSIVNINDIAGIGNPDCDCVDCDDNTIDVKGDFVPINECGCN